MSLVLGVRTGLCPIPLSKCPLNWPVCSRRFAGEQTVQNKYKKFRLSKPKVIYICRYLLIQIIPGRLCVRYRLAKKNPTSQIFLISVFALFGYLSIGYYTVALKYESKVGYARCKNLRSRDLALIRIYFLATLQPSDRIPGLRPSFNKKNFLLHDKRWW